MCHHQHHLTDAAAEAQHSYPPSPLAECVSLILEGKAKEPQKMHQNYPCLPRNEPPLPENKLERDSCEAAQTYVHQIIKYKRTRGPGELLEVARMN